MGGDPDPTVSLCFENHFLLCSVPWADSGPTRLSSWAKSSQQPGLGAGGRDPRGLRHD